MYSSLKTPAFLQSFANCFYFQLDCVPLQDRDPACRYRRLHSTGHHPQTQKAFVTGMTCSKTLGCKDYHAFVFLKSNVS